MAVGESVPQLEPVRGPRLERDESDLVNVVVEVLDELLGGGLQVVPRAHRSQGSRLVDHQHEVHGRHGGHGIRPHVDVVDTEQAHQDGRHRLRGADLERALALRVGGDVHVEGDAVQVGADAVGVGGSAGLLERHGLAGAQRARTREGRRVDRPDQAEARQVSSRRIHGQARHAEHEHHARGHEHEDRSPGVADQAAHSIDRHHVFSSTAQKTARS